MRTFYVTVQLTNGGLESLEVEIDDEDAINYDTFKNLIDEYDEKHMDYDQLGLWSKGHIIAWSEIKKK